MDDGSNNISENQGDSIFEPIPRLITVYGFITLIILTILVGIFSYFFTIPHIIQLEIIVTKDTMYAKCDIEQLDQIRNLRDISVQIPVHNTVVPVTLLQDKILLQEHNILIPVSVNKDILSSLAIRDKLVFTENITIERSSLFSKIFTKQKFK